MERRSLLIAKTVLPVTVGAGPGNPVAGHSPEIFHHAVLANGESAPAGPAKRSGFSAAVAGY